MEEVQRTYVIVEQNRKVAVQIDIETFNKIEEILENYALVQVMEEPTSDDALERVLKSGAPSGAQCL